MGKINIIFDGNYLMHSELGVFGSYKPDALSTEKDGVAFIQGVANKFFYAISQLPKGGNVVFTIDSRSWRKSVEIEDGGYKSSRQTDDGKKGGMDEETAARFFRLMTEFGRCLSRVGIIVSQISGAEGDDLVYRWSKRFYDMGESSIIISGDRDITQVVKMDGEKWIIQWNNKKNGQRFKNLIFAPEGWKDEWLVDQSAVSIFNFSIDTERDTINKLIRDQNISVETVYPDEVVFNKILAGDDGDDVPPVWIAKVPNKKGGLMTVRMTGKKPAELIDIVSQKYGLNRSNLMSKWEDDDFMQDCAGLVLRLTKDVDGSTERYVVIEAMRRNAILVWLDESVIPYNLVAEMDLHIDTMLRSNETQRHKWNKKSLFEGTRFEEDAVPDRYDPFLGMVVPD